MSLNNDENIIEREFVLDMLKKYMRFKRHGNINTVLPSGRKTVSDEHKKEVRKIWLEKQRQKKIDSGEVIKRGRPAKVLTL